MNEITIRVVGIPAPQGSKTLTRWGAMIEASKKVKPWRTDVKEAALNCYSSGALNLPVKADIEFVFPRPKSHYGTGRNLNVLKQSSPKHHVKKPDIDNYIKFYFLIIYLFQYSYFYFISNYFYYKLKLYKLFVVIK